MVQYVGDLAVQTLVVTLAKQCRIAALELMARSWSLEEQHYLAIAHLPCYDLPSLGRLAHEARGRLPFANVCGLD